MVALAARLQPTGIVSGEPEWIATGRQGGQALVELSLVLLFVCSLLVAVFDFSRVTNLYLVVVHASRVAARVASLSTTSTSDVETAAEQAAADHIASSQLTVTCGTVTLAASTGTYTLNGTCGTERTVDSAFAVTVSTTVEPIFPFTGLLFGSYSLGPISVSHTAVGVVQSEA